MKEVVLNANMGEAVLARLLDFTPLPESGYVAGQAVASAVSELFGDGRAVMYNDVDVFRAQTNEEWQNFIGNWDGIRSRRAITTTHFTTLEVEEEYRQPVLNAVDRYRVLQTKRRGLLNEIVCEFSDANPRKFLDTFDMNCVQVGVDLESRKLIWTPEFERFNRTRELEVVTLHTPFHSLIRYFKKREELEGVSGNDKRMLEMLAAAYYIEMSHGHQDSNGSGLYEYSNLRWRFGQGYREKLARVAGRILPHFSIESEVINDYEVTYLKPRFDIDKDFCISGDMPNIVHCLPRYSRALREKHSKGTHRHVSALMSRITEPGLVRDHWLAHGDDFLDADVDEDKLVKMDKIAEKHQLGMNLSSSTLSGMLSKFELVQDAVAQRGRWAYMVLANSRGLEWRREVLDGYLDKAAVSMRKKLKAPSLPILKVKGYSARELVTAMELAVELPRFGAHPAGYGENILNKSERCVVFTLPRHSRLGHLAELTRSYDRWNWTLHQVSGKHRRECGPRELQVAETYVNLTNLAVVLGKYPTAALAWAAPEAASTLGAFIGSKVLAKLPRLRRYRYGLGPKLASTLGLESPVRAANDRWYSQSDFGFWKEHAKRKVMAVFRPKEHSKLMPQYEEDAQDIPF
jgi:hypothetical protein